MSGQKLKMSRTTLYKFSFSLVPQKGKQVWFRVDHYSSGGQHGEKWKKKNSFRPSAEKQIHSRGSLKKNFVQGASEEKKICLVNLIIIFFFYVFLVKPCYRKKFSGQFCPKKYKKKTFRGCPKKLFAGSPKKTFVHENLHHAPPDD